MIQSNGYKDECHYCYMNPVVDIGGGTNFPLGPNMWFCQIFPKTA